MPKTKNKSRIAEANETWLSRNPWMGILTLLFWYIIFLYVPTMIYRFFVTYTYFTTHLYVYHIIDFFGVMLYFVVIVPFVLGLPKNRNFVGFLKETKLINIKPVFRTIILALIVAVIHLSCMLLATYLTTVIEGQLIFEPSLLVDPTTVNVYTSLKPGIWEELAFRGIILVLLLKLYSNRVSIVINGLLFGFFHATNILFAFLSALFFSADFAEELPITVIFQIVYTTFFGFVMAYLFIKSNSLIPCIIVHYSVDALSTLVTGAAYTELLIFLIMIATIGFGLLPFLLNSFTISLSCYLVPQPFDERVFLFDRLFIKEQKSKRKTRRKSKKKSSRG